MMNCYWDGTNNEGYNYYSCYSYDDGWYGYCGGGGGTGVDSTTELRNGIEGLLNNPTCREFVDQLLGYAFAVTANICSGPKKLDSRGS